MADQIKILLVEDDKNFGAVLRDYLSLHAYSVTLCEDGVEGLLQFEKESYDLCIFDVMMPKKDGFTLAEDIRKINRNVAFIFLTAKSLKEDLLRGFKLGADDFITKPFDSEVLLLKIAAILKRRDKEELPSLESHQIGAFTYHVKLRTIKNRDLEFKLSPKEGALLELLIAHRDNMLPRAKALKLIWKEDNYFTARSMDVYVAKLRKYFQSDPDVVISNIHGSGYSLKINKQ